MKIILAGFFITFSLNLTAQSFGSSFRTVDGNELSLEEVGKTTELVVIDFWATWCKPCIKSIPKLVALSEKYPKQSVRFVGINIDSPRNLSKVRPFAESLGISYPIILDSEQTLYEEYLVGAVPTLIVLSADGEVLYTHEGYAIGDEKIIEEEINQLLD